MHSGTGIKTMKQANLFFYKSSKFIKWEQDVYNEAKGLK